MTTFTHFCIRAWHSENADIFYLKGIWSTTNNDKITYYELIFSGPTKALYDMKNLNEVTMHEEKINKYPDDLIEIYDFDFMRRFRSGVLTYEKGEYKMKLG